MIDHQQLLDLKNIDNLTPKLKTFLNETRSTLKGCERREFMANVVRLMGRGVNSLLRLNWDGTGKRSSKEPLLSG